MPLTFPDLQVVILAVLGFFFVSISWFSGVPAGPGASSFFALGRLCHVSLYWSLTSFAFLMAWSSLFCVCSIASTLTALLFVLCCCSAGAVAAGVVAVVVLAFWLYSGCVVLFCRASFFVLVIIALLVLAIQCHLVKALMLPSPPGLK